MLKETQMRIQQNGKLLSSALVAFQKPEKGWLDRNSLQKESADSFRPSALE